MTTATAAATAVTIHTPEKDAYDTASHAFFMTAQPGESRTVATTGFHRTLRTSTITSVDDEHIDPNGYTFRTVTVTETTTTHYGTTNVRYGSTPRSYITRQHTATYTYSCYPDGHPHGMSTHITVGAPDPKTVGIVTDVTRFNKRAFTETHLAHLR